MEGTHQENENYDEQILTSKERDKLLDEASRTVTGSKRDEDPRDIDFLSEEAKRLSKIADELSLPSLD